MAANFLTFFGPRGWSDGTRTGLKRGEWIMSSVNFLPEQGLEKS